MKPLALVLFLLAIPVLSGQVTRKPSTPKRQTRLAGVTFEFCGRSVTLGQSQDEVLKAVTPACSISSLPPDKDTLPGDSLWVLETADHETMPGSLTFKSGRLVEVRKNWSDGRKDTAYGYAESIYDAFMSIDGKPTGYKALCNVSLALSLQIAPKADIIERYVVLDCVDIHQIHHNFNVRLMALPSANFAQFKDGVRLGK